MDFYDFLPIALMVLVFIRTWRSVGTNENIVFKGVANQSSTLHYGYPESIKFYWNASLAVDGQKSERFYINNRSTCSCTDNGNWSWWQLNFREERVIEKIVVYGRIIRNRSDPNIEYSFHHRKLCDGDCCHIPYTLAESAANSSRIVTRVNKLLTTEASNVYSNLISDHLRGFQLSLKTRDSTSWDLVFNDTSNKDAYIKNNAIYDIHMNETLRGQYVQIVNPKNNSFLVLCEVEVYAECENGKFGHNCSGVCHCLDDDRCNKTNGICDFGLCAPGWQGYICSNECEDGKFGQNCSGVCHCLNDGLCNKTNGICDSGLCSPGWQENSCSKVCEDEKFGQNCTGVCHCLGDNRYNKTTGICDSELCAPGWQGYNCSHECDVGTFGKNCDIRCHCLSSIACNHVNGICENGLCDAGFQENTCSLPCFEGFYGFNCSQTCGFCVDNQTCNTESGVCENGCDIKYTGPKCETLVDSRQNEGNGSSFTILGILLSIAAVVITAIIVAFFIKKKRHKKPLGQPRWRTDDDLLKPNENNGISIRGACLYQNAVGLNRASGKEYYSFFPKQAELKVHELWDYIKHHQSDGHFEMEFKTLPKGLTKPCTVARLPRNSAKNRYKDMYAYDQTRVVLSEKDDAGSDYINACHINGYTKMKKFIAAQGPTDATVEDFWKMIWQENVTVIVMLTNLKEIGTVKCIHYWPDNKKTYGGYTVSLKTVSDQKDYAVRELQLEKKPGNTRNIKQFHYKAWPDKTVPDSAWSLVQFWRAVSAKDTEDDPPVVVHCSAGVGRTGTFIALDILYQQARSEGCVRPLQMVEALRQQRVYMVQTKDQYIFLHEAVAEALYVGTHCVHANSFADYYAYMCENDDSTGKCRLLMQHEFSTTENLPSSASDPVYSIADGEETQRLGLDAVSDIDAGEHLEPIRITAFNRPGSILISKAIQSDVREHYIKLIAKEGIKTILTETSEDHKFKDLKVPDGVKMILYSTALECPKPDDVATFKEFVESVQNWQPFLSSSQPILIQSRSHLSHCIVVCVILGELQRLKLDGTINILEAAKQALSKHSALRLSFEQYKFCHDVLMELLVPNQGDEYANI